MKLALIGCGVWGQIILRDLIALNIEVTVFDTDPEKREQALENGASQVVDNIHSLENVAAIIVATPATTHADVIIQLDSTGFDVPIFCEKPLTDNAENAKRLLTRTGPPLFVMHIWCHHPGIRLLKKLCDQKIIGEINQIHTVRANWTSPRQDVDCLANLAPHDLSIFQYILGKIPQPIFATAEKINDHIVSCTAILKAEKNINCIFEVSNRYAEKRREIRIHGTKGVLVLPDDQIGAITHIKDGGHIIATNTDTYPYEKTSALKTELSVFIEFLKTKKSEELCSAKNGADIVFAIEKIRNILTKTPQP